MELIYSARSAEELIYADELDGDVTVTLTREAPEGWTGPTGRINADLIARAAADSGVALTDESGPRDVRESGATRSRYRIGTGCSVLFVHRVFQ